MMTISRTKEKAQTTMENPISGNEPDQLDYWINPWTD